MVEEKRRSKARIKDEDLKRARRKPFGERFHNKTATIIPHLKEKLKAAIADCNEYAERYIRLYEDVDFKRLCEELDIDPSRFKDGKFDETVTLEDLSKLERLGYGAIYYPTSAWKLRKLSVGLGEPGTRDFQGTLSLHEDIPHAMVEDLVAANANWRVLAGVVYFAIPKHIADKYNFSYEPCWWTKSQNPYVLTDDGFVVSVVARWWPGMFRREGSSHLFISTMFGAGVWTRHRRGKQFLYTDCSAKRLFCAIPAIGRDEEIERIGRYVVPSIGAIREAVLTSVMVATGDRDLATGLSYGLAGSKYSKDFSSFLNGPRFLGMVEDRARKAMTSIMNRLGIEGDPDQYVLNTLIRINEMVLENIQDDKGNISPRLVHALQENTDRLIDLLAMKPEHRMVTTERRLELTSGEQTLIASEIERKKAELVSDTDELECVGIIHPADVVSDGSE